MQKARIAGLFCIGKKSGATFSETPEFEAGRVFS
jgi:hypothetical protein